MTVYYKLRQLFITKGDRSLLQNVSGMYQYGREPYRNLPKNEKQRLTEYKKKYSKIQKIKTG